MMGGPLLYQSTRKMFWTGLRASTSKWLLITIAFLHSRTISISGYINNSWLFVIALDRDKLVLGFLEDVKNTLELRSLTDGTYIQNFDLDVGTITGYIFQLIHTLSDVNKWSAWLNKEIYYRRYSGKRQHSEFFYQFASFLSPGRIFHCDFSTTPFSAKVLISCYHFT